MTPVKHTPLFNRRYLFWLMCLLPLIIALLHLSGQQPEIEADFLQWQAEPPHYRAHISTQTEPQLLLIWQHSPTFSTQGRLQQAQLQYTLEHWLQQPQTQHFLQTQQWQPTLLMQSNQVRLSLQAATPPTDAALTALLAALPDPEALPEQRRAELEAEAHLFRQGHEGHLLERLGDWINSDGNSVEQPLLLLSGANLPRLPTTTAPPIHLGEYAPRLPAQQQQEYARLRSPYLLAAWSLPVPVTAEEFALARANASAIQQALPELLPPNTDYRLLWHADARHSWLALLLQPPPGRALPRADEFALNLQQGVTVPHWDAARQQLLMESSTLSPEWMAITARLQLPLDSHRVFRATLETPPDGALPQTLQQWLQPEHQLWLELQPFTLQEPQSHESP